MPPCFVHLNIEVLNLHIIIEEVLKETTTKIKTEEARERDETASEIVKSMITLARNILLEIGNLSWNDKIGQLPRKKHM